MGERLTVAEVEEMVAAGLVPERSELLGGRLVMTPPYGPSHATIVTVLFGLLYDRYRGVDVCVRSQVPLICGLEDEPQPDVSIVRGRSADFAEHHPQGVDAVLVIEVSDSSRRLDRKKADLYARSGVPKYWIVNVVAHALETHSSPHAGRYTRHATLQPDEHIALPVTRRRILVKRLLG